MFLPLCSPFPGSLFLLFSLPDSLAPKEGKKGDPGNSMSTETILVTNTRTRLPWLPRLPVQGYLWRLFSKRFYNTQYTHPIQLRNMQAIPLNVFWLFLIILFDSSYYKHSSESLKASKSEQEIKSYFKPNEREVAISRIRSYYKVCETRD